MPEYEIKKNDCKTLINVLYSTKRSGGETGIHERLKISCRKACGFDSHPDHIKNFRRKGGNFYSDAGIERAEKRRESFWKKRRASRMPSICRWHIGAALGKEPSRSRSARRRVIPTRTTNKIPRSWRGILYFMGLSPQALRDKRF